MTPGQHRNLRRLLSPRHIACIGGSHAAFAVELCAAAGFKGQIWGVNPTRDELGGRPCFGSVDELPEAPDAVFLAVPGHAAQETVSALSSIGAGGVVSFTAGFGELGEQGAARERNLIEAAGDLALVGPNCSGLLNFVHNALLWPFHHGGEQGAQGVAIVTQSGMLGNTLSLNQRSVPFSYIISSGNQAMLGIEDFLEVLIEDPAVTGIGLYIETLRDISRFSELATHALNENIPIVVHKAGASKIGSRLTFTHTGSLSGGDELYQALFDRLGVVRVRSPVMLLETLKMLTVAGAPTGKRVAAFTCSGGDATMLADEGERLGLEFPQPSDAVSEKLAARLPDIATVSNPLDYTTPLWGDEENLPGLLADMLQDGYDSALMVQDYPDPGPGVSRAEYLSDARCFISATRAAGVPAAVCSCLPETLDGDCRNILAAGGVAPLQGITDALLAISGATAYGIRRHQLVSRSGGVSPGIPCVESIRGTSRLLDEWEGKLLLRDAGIPVPEGRLTTAELAAAEAVRLGFPVAVKMVSESLPHKSDAGALKLGLNSADEVANAVAEIRKNVADRAPGALVDRFLIERMVAPPVVAELLLGVRHDDRFGQVMVIASGGVLVELAGDSRILLLPVDRLAVADALASLKLSRLLDGYRGRAKADREMVIDCVMTVAGFAESMRSSLLELDINPLMIQPAGVVAADALVHVSSN